MKKYINMIALLASAFIENMKKEVRTRQYTIIGSHLFEETWDGKDLGTMMDHVLMHMEMGMEEDMMEKQLQNSFLADGSTIEEEVDTAAEGPEEEEETNVNKTSEGENFTDEVSPARRQPYHSLETGTGSFVCMEENTAATHVMFHSASESLLGNLKKLHYYYKATKRRKWGRKKWKTTIW